MTYAATPLSPDLLTIGRPKPARREDCTQRLLDRLNDGVILIDRAHRVVFANHAALALARQGSELRIHQQRVSARHPEQQREIELAMRAVSRGDPARIVRLCRMQACAVLNVTISSVRAGDCDRFADFGWRDVALLLFIAASNGTPQTSSQWLIEGYGLTQAESRVATLCGQGVSPRQIAEQMRLSINTIKTHLRRVYAKCGVRRQAELVRMLQSPHRMTIR